MNVLEKPCLDEDCTNLAEQGSAYCQGCREAIASMDSAYDEKYFISIYYKHLGDSLE